MDAGWGREDERDAKRIQDAMADANIDHIDYFHYVPFSSGIISMDLPALWRVVCQLDNLLTMVIASNKIETKRCRPPGDAYLSVAEGKTAHRKTW